VAEEVIADVGVIATSIPSWSCLNNLTLRGGPAPVRAYMRELMDDVLAGTLDPSPVFDMRVDLDGVPEGYAAMDARRALKVLVKL
jgi:alcohol dehydrogenase